MKHMKKFTAMLLAVIMVLGMALSASAATVTNDTSHTYVAYQILTGTQATDKGTLGDVEWGTGINDEAFVEALQEDPVTADTFAGVNSAADFANKLNNVQNDSELAKAVARIADANKSTTSIELPSGASTLEDGYYLIVDTTNVNGEYDAKNTSLLQVTDSIKITQKSAKPTVDKQVQDETDDAEDGSSQGWGETADHNINESFQFKLT
ncbi:MAG: hypothetical protein J6Q54_02845, partial [Oscillospiraceae bacterium]|nr:hypothetical protein [Oscillospiraceae bacterium]